MPINFDDAKQNQKVKELYEKEEEDLAQILSNKYGIPYADLTATPIDTDALRLISEETSKNAKLAAFNLTNKKLSIAIQSPNNEITKSELKSLENRGYFINLFIVSTKSLKKAWERYNDISFASRTASGTLDVANQDITDFANKINSIEDVVATIDEISSMKKSFRISRIVEIIIASGIGIGASDIHIEPEDEQVSVRFRLDGVLTKVASFDFETYKLLLSRIKLLSKMKLNIKNTAQDGRFSVKIGKDEIEVRSSVLPDNNGESIVMRLLNPNSITVPITSLGMPEKLLNKVLKEIEKPNGMILNTGPTGSGKTTALYSFLNRRRDKNIKIITIEDPIEYHLSGVVQTQVDKKRNYDFADGLKASLRQDPDIIMVGEIRDSETAETAIHAALTGHLVFSTLHTNNAAGAFTRLIDIGINPKIVTSAVSTAIAQRLVRKVCQDCKEKIQATDNEKILIEKVLNNIADPDKPVFDGTLYKSKGCDKCNKTGFKGRIGVFEAIFTDSEIEKVVQESPSEREIQKAAIKQGNMTIAQDGIVKVINGITTLEEVQRVINFDIELGLE
jgi:type IV pilus assembly protein PilB